MLVVDTADGSKLRYRLVITIHKINLKSNLQLSCKVRLLVLLLLLVLGHKVAQRQRERKVFLWVVTVVSDTCSSYRTTTLSSRGKYREIQDTAFLQWMKKRSYTAHKTKTKWQKENDSVMLHKNCWRFIFLIVWCMMGWFRDWICINSRFGKRISVETEELQWSIQR